MIIVNIISSSRGGGAEVLVNELHQRYVRRKFDAYAIYSISETYSPSHNETVLGINPRNPLNIILIREILKLHGGNGNGNVIAHVHLTWPFFYASLASLGLNNVRLIYTEHNTTNKRRNISLLWVLERLLYSRYERIICISDAVRKSLENWVGSKISQRLVTIPNGSRVYAVIERSTLEGRTPRLISVGSLSSRKNFATAIIAIAQLRDEVESYAIIGEGSERPRLERLIEDLKLGDKVKLLGWSDDIEAHLHAADIQLIPSLWEGFGLVAVEGMSTGLPVVASNVDGLREVLDEDNPSVILVDSPESVDEWVSCIRGSVENIHDKGFNSIATTSRHQAEKFTLEKMADQYLATYRDVLAEQNN